MDARPSTGASPQAGGRGISPHIPERLRYLGTFAEYAALAGLLRATRKPPRDPRENSQNHRVTCLSPHPSGHRAVAERFTRWVPHLERLGWDVEILTPASEDLFSAYRSGQPGADTRYYHECIRDGWRNIWRAATADVVVLHRGLFPFSPWQRPTFEAQLARLNPRLVYDFYDPLWVDRALASERSSSRLGRWLHPPDKIEQIIGLARVVTVSNEELATFARRFHRDVRIVPMVTEPDDYDVRHHEPRTPVVLGWLGAKNNIPRLLALAPALRRLAATRDIVVRVVAPEPVEIPGVPVECHTHPWSTESERADLAALDIGLLPLDETSATDKGKSPFKLIQYCAGGLAVVATPLAIDFAVLPPGECFLPARDENEWVEAMTRLVDDASLRAALGSAAREAVERHLSFESQAPVFHGALLAAAGRQDPAGVPSPAAHG